MPDKLKPCPFCGGSNLSVDYDKAKFEYCIFCDKCGPACFDKYEIDSIHAWNNRAKNKEEKWKIEQKNC